MATFASAVLFVVLFTVVTANSTNISVFTISNPLPLEINDTQTTSSVLKANPLKPDRYHIQLKPKPVQELNKKSKFQAFFEKKLLQEQRTRDVQSVQDFWRKRSAVADYEIEKLFGNHIPLEGNELKANSIILSKKYEEYDKSLNVSELFPPSINFFQAKGLIEQSEIYKILRKLPKGANLYSRLLTSVDLYFMYRLTFEEGLYYRFEDGLKFVFSKTRPAPGWRLLSHLRSTNNSDYIDDLNKAIKESLNLIIPYPKEVDDLRPRLKFPDVMRVYTSLTRYKPNFIKTFNRALEILYEDNIMYAEFGYDFPDLYDLDGKFFNPTETLRLSKVILDDFKKAHKDFVGVRFIYIPVLNSSTKTGSLREFRETAIDLRRADPDLFAGFGITRNEDALEPLSDLVEELLKFPKEIKFYFNVGFTNAWGTNADYNLLDALTLNPAIIGEGFALNKHPVVIKKLREKNVAVGFCPISAQALSYVEDLRNHPITLLISTDFPVVVGNAGGTFWNATGVSYDWYEFYLAMTPRFCDIRCLKQLALNSWLYCSLSLQEKKKSITAWQVMWDKFIDYIVNNYT